MLVDLEALARRALVWDPTRLLLLLLLLVMAAGQLAALRRHFRSRRFRDRRVQLRVLGG
jgi:hypothetical protein